MKKYFILLLALVVLSVSNICSASLMEDPMAILPFGTKLTVESNIRISDTEDARSVIEEELMDIASFNLITRTEINRMCEELRFQQSDLVNPDTTARLGQLLGAKYLFITNITGMSREGNTHNVHLTSKIIELETGRILAAGRGTGKSKDLSSAFSMAAENAIKGPKGIAVKLGFKTR